MITLIIFSRKIPIPFSQKEKFVKIETRDESSVAKQSFDIGKTDSNNNFFDSCM